MRYIGSKVKVLPFIRETIWNTYGDFSAAVAGDLFSGTACVAEMFKKEGAEVITNDYMRFAYALQIEKIKLNRAPEGVYPYPQLVEELNQKIGVEGFFYRSYTKEGTSGETYERNYFSGENAKKIDAIRTTIQAWYDGGVIGEDMYYLLIANLIDAVTKVSNTSGTYGAFLKGDDPRKARPLVLRTSEFVDNGKQNQCYCNDVFEIIDQVGGDILYLDPPYNSRQYPPYYHILDTVARYDHPAIYGKTGRRPYQDQISPLCIADQAAGALLELVERARFRHIYISYSTEGIVDHSDLTARLERLGTTQCFFRPHRRYKSNSGEGTDPRNKLKEIIIYVQK